MIPIIITTYKAPEKLKKCLEAIGNSSFKDHEIFIRDNTLDNILFTKAVNEGLRKYAFNGDVEHVLVLSDDVILDTNCLQTLKNYADQHPKSGITCPIQLSDGRITWAGSFEAFPAGRHDQRPIKEPKETFWANGACMLLSTKMIKEIGLLDEGMKFICSDSDYSFTARSRGWSVSVVSNAFVDHKLGESANQSNLELTKVKIGDVLYFMHKWLTGELYRSLSFEGLELSNNVIKQEYYRLINIKKKISELSIQVPASVHQP